MSKRNSIVLTLSLIIFLSSVSAQNAAKLTLDEAIELSLRSNKAILISETEEQVAQANFRQTNAVYLPQASLSYTAMTSNNPLNVFGFKLQQQSVAAADFNPDLLNEPSASENYTARADVQVPLLNMDMLYMRRAAYSQVEMRRLQTMRTREHIVFEVKNAYYQLQLAHEAVTVLQDAQTSATATLDFVDKRFRQGLVQKSDVLNAKIQVTTVERNLAEARSNVRNASDYLGILMGKTTGTIYEVERISTGISAEQERMESVPENRSDFRAMEKAIEATGYAAKSGRLSYLPKLNAFGTYQFNDNEALGFGSSSYLAGVQLSWDIFKGTRTKFQVDSKRLEREKLTEQLRDQKNKSQLELEMRYRQLDDAKIAISQQLVTVEHAEETLAIVRNRYEQGLVNTSDVLMADAQLAQQRLGLSQAYYKHHITLAYIAFLTSAN